MGCCDLVKWKYFTRQVFVVVVVLLVVGGYKCEKERKREKER